MAGGGNGEKDRRDLLAAMQQLGPLFGAGIQMAAAVVLMFFVGRWLDGKWNTTPWMMLTGIMIGVSAGFYQFIKIVTDVNKSEKSDGDKPGAAK